MATCIIEQSANLRDEMTERRSSVRAEEESDERESWKCLS